MKGLSSRGPPFLISQNDRKPVRKLGYTQIDYNTQLRKQLYWFRSFVNPNSLPTYENLYMAYNLAIVYIELEPN